LATATAFVELTSALRQVSPQRAVSCRRCGSTGRLQRHYSWRPDFPYGSWWPPWYIVPFFPTHSQWFFPRSS